MRNNGPTEQGTLTCTGCGQPFAALITPGLRKRELCDACRDRCEDQCRERSRGKEQEQRVEMHGFYDRLVRVGLKPQRTYEEVAAILGISLQCVEKTEIRALSKVRKLMEDYWHEHRN